MKRVLIVGILVFTTSLVVGETSPPGPTVFMSYEESTAVRNPIDVFMYFIPLTSPVRVKLEKSAVNSQAAWITAYDLRTSRGKFRLRCDFTIQGEGYFINEFNPHDIIEFNTRDFDKPKTTINLDYMRFEGDGLGRIEIQGIIDNGTPDVTDLKFDFTGRGAKSPALLGLYSIDPVDGVYDFESRYGFTQARISSLSFEKPKPGESPKMKVKLTSFGNASSPDGFFASIKAAFVNLFVPPTEVNPVGNGVLLDFARALYLKQDLFEFPSAVNLETAQ